ncbi:MAG: adenylate/guanylate cyclase domain-containing protein [Spirochaetales bacterium]|nr:adenylate/guanylate cyclase domain-containing protein [Spirochaetales bacterium]
MQPKDHRLAAVMFTDIVGFSRMMEQDEKGTLSTLDFHNQLIRELIGANRGTEIKTIGDAFMVQFPTTLDAVQCALSIQEGIHKYNASSPPKPLQLRIGIHVGDIYFYENDALGEGINIASRLQTLSKPGHITISREVYSQVSGKIPMRVESLGQVQLKNISREIHAYGILPEATDIAASSEPVMAPAPSTPAFSRPSESLKPSEPYRDFKDVIKDAVLQEVQLSLKGKDAWKASRREYRERFHAIRRHYRHQIDATEVSYSENLRKEISPRAAGWRSHFSSFLSVNAGLFFINMMTAQPFDWSKGWFWFPLLGWGIGFLSHTATWLASRKNAKEAQKLATLQGESLTALKRFHKDREGFSAHVWSNAGVSILLLWIWYFSGGGFLWPMIPIAAMGVGVISHLSAFLHLRKAWKKGRDSVSETASVKASSTISSSSDAPVILKAENLKQAILVQIQTWKGANPLGDDTAETLENYVRQIRELSAIEHDLSAVIDTIRIDELEAERLELLAKADKTTSTTLKEEYIRSVEEISKQKRSALDLGEQQEILNLRIGSALKGLQQMQIDLARIKSLSDGQKQTYTSALKAQSEELSRYLEDYRSGLEESGLEDFDTTSLTPASPKV